MAFDYSTTIDYTATIPMVRTLALLLASKTDSEIKDILLNQAVPSIAGYLMQAQNSEGQHIFYVALGDMADDVLANKAEQLVAAVMSEPLVAGYIRNIAAKFAAATLLAGGAGGFIGSQAGASERLEARAMADLKYLIKGDLVSKSINSALPKVSIPETASIYFALDADPVGVAYTGAMDNGTITATINGFSVSADIEIGDTPLIILNKISAAINSSQGTGAINITAGPNDGPPVLITRNISVTDPFGVPNESVISYRTNLVSLDIFPFKYDKVVDVAVVTIQITNNTGGPAIDDSLGMTGIVYGTNSNATSLTQKGPYSVAVDLKTGKTTPLDDPNKAIISDSLFFQSDNPTLSDDTFTYRVNGGVIQTVDIPAGTDVHTAVELLARDLADKSLDQRILGAVRPATKLTVYGSSVMAPGLSLVSIGLDKLYSKFVFTLVSSPKGIRFGVVPPSMIAGAIFDEFTKSVVINTTIGTSASYTQTQPDGASALGKTGNSYVSTHKPSASLKRLLDLIGDPNSPLDPNGPPS